MVNGLESVTMEMYILHSSVRERQRERDECNWSLGGLSLRSEMLKGIRRRIPRECRLQTMAKACYFYKQMGKVLTVVV